MEPKDNPTNEAKPGAESTPAAGGQTAVSDPAGLTLAEINEATGKTYKTKEAALKSIKDMNTQAGKAADLEGRTKSEDDRLKAVEESNKNLELELFYSKNPDHEANREVLEALALKNGVSVKEAVELPAYKAIVETKQQAEASQSRRTVADTNGRRAQTSAASEEHQAAVGDKDKSAEYVLKHHFPKQ